MDGQRFEELEHTADIAIRVWGATLTKLFLNAAHGMACQLAAVEGVDATIEKEINLQADDLETLMVEWLSELLYLSERHRAVFVQFDVREFDGHTMHAIVRGGAVGHHHAHIKAVTFSELDVRRTDSGYETHIVFDV